MRLIIGRHAITAYHGVELGNREGLGYRVGVVKSRGSQRSRLVAVYIDHPSQL